MTCIPMARKYIQNIISTQILEYTSIQNYHTRNDPSDIFGSPSSWTFCVTAAARGKKPCSLYLLAEKWQVQAKFGFSLKVIAIICFLMDIGWLKSCTKNLRRFISEVKIFLRGGVSEDLPSPGDAEWTRTPLLLVMEEWRKNILRLASCTCMC